MKINDGRINFKQSVIKKVRENSGGLCCHPDCLITVNSSTSQVCHIYSASKNGPRGHNGLPKEFIASEKNGILLCKNHHGLADPNHRPIPASKLILWKNIREFSQRFLIDNLETGRQVACIGVKLFNDLIWKQLKINGTDFKSESNLDFDLESIIDTDILKKECNSLFCNYLKEHTNTDANEKPEFKLNKITEGLARKNSPSNDDKKNCIFTIVKNIIPTELYYINEIKEYWFSEFKINSDSTLITYVTCYIGSNPSEINADNILLEINTNATAILSAASLHSGKDNFFRLTYFSDFFNLNLSITYENNLLTTENKLTPAYFIPKNINLNTERINLQARAWKKIIDKIISGEDLFIFLNKKPYTYALYHSIDDIFPHHFKIQKENLSLSELNRINKIADKILLANYLVRIIEGETLSGSRFIASNCYFGEYFSENDIINSAHAIKNKIDKENFPLEDEIGEANINGRNYKLFLNYNRGNIEIKIKDLSINRFLPYPTRTCHTI